MNQLTVNELSEAVPKQFKGRVTQELVDTVNQLNLDPDFREMYRDNLISYGSVLKDSKWTVAQYMDAVRYVSYKIMGDTNTKAYMRTFPSKIQQWKAAGVADKTIARYVTAYNKNKLVNLIWEQSSIPFYSYNQDYRQRALMVQVELMQNAKSEKVRSDAANSVLTHLKPPETAKIELDITHKEDSVIKDLRTAVQELTIAQRRSIEAGGSTAKEIAHSRIIEAEAEEVVVNG